MTIKRNNKKNLFHFFQNISVKLEYEIYTKARKTNTQKQLNKKFKLLLVTNIVESAELASRDKSAIGLTKNKMSSLAYVVAKLYAKY